MRLLVRARLGFVISGDPAVCPYDIDRPVMMQRWATLTFLHWSFAPDAAAHDEAPIAHFSEGVDVRIGRPERVE